MQAPNVKTTPLYGVEINTTIKLFGSTNRGEYECLALSVSYRGLN